MNEKKKHVINHYKHTIEWVEKLNSLSEEQWRTPIEKGKWTIAEVIGHLIPWDEFVVCQRLPYLVKGMGMPKSPDTQIINDQASIDSQARTKEETIKRLVESRQYLIHVINMLEDDLWEREFKIGSATLSLYPYFEALAVHDKHHFEQIERII
ncbi:MAG: DinB family protein [Bacillaceae bacterium]